MSRKVDIHKVNKVSKSGVTAYNRYDTKSLIWALVKEFKGSIMRKPFPLWQLQLELHNKNLLIVIIAVYSR